MKRLYCFPAIFFFLFLACTAFAQYPPSICKLYPLPISELEGLIDPWLKSSGFCVSRSHLGMGQILLSASREGTYWELILKPHSPLATEILFQQDDNRPINRGQFDGLLGHLNDYIGSLADSNAIDNEMAPAAVKLLRQAIVCIKAKLNEKELQITGFFADKQGLIISTAHDLTEMHQIRVIVRDGQEFDAIVVKISLENDLALLHISHTPFSYISLTTERDVYQADELLFSLSCLNNQPGTINVGTVMDPPVIVNNQLLWKMNMQIRHGSSGSPVVDGKGNLLGVVKGKHRGSDSIGFMIPYATVIEFLQGT